MDVALHYYDLVLAAIITSIGVGVGVGVLTPLSMAVAVILFGAVAAALVGHALFVNGPHRRRPGPRRGGRTGGGARRRCSHAARRVRGQAAGRLRSLTAEFAP